MIIKNFEIEGFGKFLFGLSLKGKESRMRTRFVRLLDEQLILINDEREQLINDYAKKDEDGELITEEKDGHRGFVLEDPIEFNNEINKLMFEDFIIEESIDKIEMLKVVKDVVLNCELEFSGMEAVDYDRWCAIVEDIGE